MIEREITMKGSNKETQLIADDLLRKCRSEVAKVDPGDAGYSNVQVVVVQLMVVECIKAWARNRYVLQNNNSESDVKIIVAGLGSGMVSALFTEQINMKAALDFFNWTVRKTLDIARAAAKVNAN